MSHKTEPRLGHFLTNQFGDRYLYEVNRNIFNQAGSDAYFSKQFGREMFRSDRLYIIVGTDSGLLLNYLLKSEIPEGSRYIFVELPSVLNAIKKEGLLENLPQRVAVVEAQDLEAQAAVFQFQNYVYLEAAEVRESFAALDAHICSYRELSEATLNWIRRESNSIAANIGVASFMVRQFENLAENRQPAAILKGTLKGETAVLLAGGPSLDEIIPWVKENRDQLVVFAVSRISRQLLMEGLYPDFVVSVDPQDLSFEVSREMLHLFEKSIFIHSYHVSPLLLGQWQGRSFYLGDLFPWSTSLNKKNIPVSGPTVTNSALTFAIEVGCSNIVLAGVDLCFSRHGNTHASGSVETKIGPLLSTMALKVETNDGSQAETSANYFSAIDVLKSQAVYAKSQGCCIINPASGAVKIAGIKHVSLNNIELKEVNSSFLREKVANEKRTDRIEHYHMVLKELGRAEEAINKVCDLANKALFCNDGLFGRKGKKANFKYKSMMDDIEKKINRDYSDFSICIKQYGIRSFLKITRSDSSKKWTNEEIEESGRVYYESYKKSSISLIEHIKEASIRIKSRLEEESSDPDAETIVRQWIRDSQPGRYRIWKNRNIIHDERIKKRLEIHEDTLEEEFNALMTDSDTSQLKMLKQAHSLLKVRSKSLALFSRRDNQGLRNLLESLEKHPDKENAFPYFALAQGYLAELEENFDLALESYQKLIGETLDPLSEDALKRIASVCIGREDTKMALLAMDCLSNASVVYKPQYGDLLRITGQRQEAADVYTDYLEQVPSDLIVLLKLGQLYGAMGHEDAAVQIFNMVLEQDPENSVAKSLLGEAKSHA